jgi:hypothetical protein
MSICRLWKKLSAGCTLHPISPGQLHSSSEQGITGGHPQRSGARYYVRAAAALRRPGQRSSPKWQVSVNVALGAVSPQIITMGDRAETMRSTVALSPWKQRQGDPPAPTPCPTRPALNHGRCCRRRKASPKVARGFSFEEDAAMWQWYEWCEYEVLFPPRIGAKSQPNHLQ